jgi:hypothetical protein
MRQYRIMFRRSGSKPGVWATLRPFENSGLYDKPEVNAAIELIRTNPHFVGIAVQLGDEIYNIVAFDQAAEAPLSFKFPEVTSSSVSSASPVESGPP